jgi:hypothetical protein
VHIIAWHIVYNVTLLFLLQIEAKFPAKRLIVRVMKFICSRKTLCNITKNLKFVFITVCRMLTEHMLTSKPFLSIMKECHLFSFQIHVCNFVTGFQYVKKTGLKCTICTRMVQKSWLAGTVV